MALLLAIRHGDYRVVREMVQVTAAAGVDSADVNEEAHLESATAVPQELPSFPTTPLLEACRCGDERILRLLLARSDVDVNKRTTKLRHTALADACARGDALSVRILLEDPRTDAALGDELVAHPALYACMNGSVEVLQALASHGVLNDDLEASLVATAAASEQVRRPHSSSVLRSLRVASTAALEICMLCVVVLRPAAAVRVLLPVRPLHLRAPAGRADAAAAGAQGPHGVRQARVARCARVSPHQASA